MLDVGTFAFEIAIDNSAMGIYLGHVLHMHAWGAIRRETVRAVKTSEFVS